MADRSADRHVTRPLSFRPSEAVRAWVAGKAEVTGKPRQRVILDALEAAREADPLTAYESWIVSEVPADGQ